MMTASSVLEELESEETKNIYLRRQPSTHVLVVKFGEMGNIFGRIGRDSSLRPCT
jgi:hypothetical protein